MYSHATKTYVREFIYNNIISKITAKIYRSMLPDTSMLIDEHVFKNVKTNIYDNCGVIIFINNLKFLNKDLSKPIQEQVLTIISKNP